MGLGGTAASVNYSGAWTPGADNVYRVGGGALTLGGADQLTDFDVDTACSLEVDGGILKITGNHSFSGGTVLKAGAKVAAGAGSLGAGDITMESGSRLLANFGVNQTFINRLTGPTGTGENAVLQLGASTNADLDFTGLGQIALAGRSRSADPEIEFGGSWTPSDNVYRIAGQDTHTVFLINNWGAQEPAALRITKANALSDGTSARSLEVGEGAYLLLDATNSYTGETKIQGGYNGTSDTHVTLLANNALGTGEIIVDHAALSTSARLDNTIRLSGPDSIGGGALLINAGGKVTGQVNMLNTTLSRANYDNLPSLVMWGGEFSGTLNIQGASFMQLDAGVFSGGLSLANGADAVFSVGNGMRVTSAWTITGGNTLLIDYVVNGSAATFESNLTLHSEAVFQLQGFSNTLLYGEGVTVALGNAWFDASGSSTGEDWSLLTGTATAEYMIVGPGGLYDGTNGFTGYANGQITGSLRVKNPIDGYDIAFELRNGSTELWAVVSAAAPIPEPSTYGAAMGMLAFGVGMMRRRKSRARSR